MSPDTITNRDGAERFGRGAVCPTGNYTSRKLHPPLQNRTTGYVAPRRKILIGINLPALRRLQSQTAQGTLFLADDVVFRITLIVSIA